jgi:hypothetical protein
MWQFENFKGINQMNTGLLQSHLAAKPERKIWEFDVYSDNDENSVCCKVAARAETVEKALESARNFLGSDHSNSRIELHGIASDGEVIFSDGEDVRLMGYTPVVSDIPVDDT